MRLAAVIPHEQILEIVNNIDPINSLVKNELC